MDESERNDDPAHAPPRAAPPAEDWWDGDGAPAADEWPPEELGAPAGDGWDPDLDGPTVHEPPEGPGNGADPAAQIAAIYGDGAYGRPPLVALEGGGEDPPAGARSRPKIKWLRLLALLSGLGLLAAVSTVFGMMMAVAADLPEVEVLDVATRSSRIVDRNGKDLGVLTGNENRILVRSDEIAPVMKHAIVAIEDRRFYTNSGVDVRAIGRALWQDVVARKAVQGGSTIAQQLVKNRLAAQDDRTIFQKLREAAMAFHMTRKWDKQRILRNYLNTIYFGNGAYGIESAARTYFGAEFGIGTDTPQCGSGRGQRRCAALLEPQQAALLAGVVASPSGYDPVANPEAATSRRNLVLQRMVEQGYLTQPQFETAIAEPIPTQGEVQPPQETSRYPYFTTWVRQQVVDKVGAGRAFEGGLRVETTIDAELQEAAQAAVTEWLGADAGTNGKPAAALVALDNRTSEVLAMVGGPPGGYNEQPFNLATQGQRQPGSAFKPFILAQALQEGYTPGSTFTSARKEFCVTRRKGECTEVFEVNNYEDTYAGLTNLANATAFSDNAVYAELGLELGTGKIARLARDLGIRTPVSDNYAMTLGGLSQGVTVLDMAHAYASLANDGQLAWGSLSPGVESFESDDERGTVPGPVGIREIQEPRGPDSTKFRTARLLDGERAVNRTEDKRVLPEEVASNVQTLLEGVLLTGTGRRAYLGPDVTAAGKTGTTENYGDAWFVGWTDRYTVAVWVGFPDSIESMEPPTFSFNGEPVAGGTYPAVIWNSFMRQALAIHQRRNPDEEPAEPTGEVVTAPETTAPAPEATDAAPAAPESSAPTAPDPAPPAEQAPAQPAVPEDPPPDPAPEAPAPAGGDGGGGLDPGGTTPPSGGEAPAG